MHATQEECDLGRHLADYLMLWQHEGTREEKLDAALRVAKEIVGELEDRIEKHQNKK